MLPSLLRGGTAYYGELDLEAVNAARALGVDADFLDPVEDRRFLSEFSSGLVLTIAMAVAQDLGVDALKAAGGYILATINDASRRGLLRDRKDVNVRIRANRWRRDGDVIEIEGLDVTASGEEAVRALLHGLGAPDRVDAALRELESSAQVDD